MNFSFISKAAVVCAISTVAAHAEWNPSLDAGMKQAATSKKDLLVLFTGSDWCPPCMALEKNVLSNPEIVKTLESKYELVRLDYPRSKQQDPAERKANEEAAQKYEVNGFPTVMLMTADGKAYASKVGGHRGEAAEYPKELEVEATKGKEAVKQLAEAGKLEGMDKAKAMVAALKKLPNEMLPLYKSELEQIQAIDKDDSLGFTAPILQKQQLEELREKVIKLARAKQLDEADAEVDKFLANDKLTKNVRQEALLKFKFGRLMQSKQYDKAMELFDKIIALDPESELGREAAEYKPRILEMINNEKAKQQEAAKSDEQQPVAPKPADSKPE